jgi:membrane-bound ClpP family serine protease
MPDSREPFMRRTAMGIGLIRSDGQQKLQDWRLHVLMAAVLALLAVVMIVGTLWRHEGLVQGALGIVFLILAFGQAWFATTAKRRAAARKSPS